MGKDRVHICGSIVAYSSVIYKEEGMYIAWSPEYDIACQGETLEEAVNDLETSVRLYMTHPHAKIPRIDFVAVSSRVMQIQESNKTAPNCEDCLV